MREWDVWNVCSRQMYRILALASQGFVRGRRHTATYAVYRYADYRININFCFLMSQSAISTIEFIRSLSRLNSLHVSRKTIQTISSASLVEWQPDFKWLFDFERVQHQTDKKDETKIRSSHNVCLFQSVLRSAFWAREHFKRISHFNYIIITYNVYVFQQYAIRKMA